MRSKLTPMLVISLIAVTVALAASATAASGPSRQAVYQAPQGYYLALGDSIAYGVQPTKPEARPSTVPGYVDPFAARLRKLSPTIEVVNYGCPGESTVTFAKGGCPWLAEGRKLHDPFRGSQLAAALAFLRAHPGDVSPITLTLWGNDLAPLSAKGTRAPKAIASFASRFKAILRQLRAAAPTAEIIVTGAWNPEADQLEQAEPLYRSLDATIARAAAASGPVSRTSSPCSIRRGRSAPKRARLCTLTFSCKQDPHPTDAGYRAMAEAFMTASGYPRKP